VDGFAEKTIDKNGLILDFRTCGDYKEPIPSSLMVGLTVDELMYVLPEYGFDGVWARARLAMKTGIIQPIYFKHPVTWGDRVGYAIPPDNETVILRAFIPKSSTEQKVA
jgi:hypothetical protein